MQPSQKNVLYYASKLVVSSPSFCAKTKLYTATQTLSLDIYVLIQVASSFWQQNQSDKLVGVCVGISVIVDLFLFWSGFAEQQICSIWAFFKFLSYKLKNIQCYRSAIPEIQNIPEKWLVAITDIPNKTYTPSNLMLF